MRLVLRLRVPLGFFFAAWYVSVAHPSSLHSFIISVVLVGLGCSLRSWAAGYLLKGKRIAVGGPYAYVRNPLYAGSFIIAIGFCVALWKIPPAVPAIVIWTAFILGFIIVYIAKSRAEEKELAAHLGEPYKIYASRVPALLPLRGRVPGLGEQRFSWELYRRNREYECLLGSGALLLFLYWRYRHGL